MNASTPYDVHPEADVILRSSDNVHFYVLGPLLRFFSPFFADLFLINKGSAIDENEKQGGRPVIPLEEDSATIRLLLDLLYPYAKEPPLTDVTLVWSVGKMAQKYLIDVIDDKLKDRIVSSGLLSESPLRVYAVAVDLGWDGVAIEAARKTLNIPLGRLVYVDELRSISGSEFYCFLEYRLRCSKSSNPTTEVLMSLPDTSAEDTNVEATTAAALSNANLDAPFLSSESTPTSDLILRSSDSIDFHVVEPLIRLVSPDFDSVFPLEGREIRDERTVIRVTEDSKTLLQLLNIIYYYVDKLDIDNYQLYRDVAEAAKKYKMSVIEKKLRDQLLTSPLIRSEPLRIYILGTVLHWDDVSKVAALNALFKPLQEMSYIGELSRITGGDLFRLVRFRFKCSDAAWNALKTETKFEEYGPSRWSHYWRGNTRNSNQRASISFDEFSRRVKACPRGATISEIYQVELKNLETADQHIRVLSFEGNFRTIFHIIKCWNDLGELVEEAVSKVSLDKP